MRTQKQLKSQINTLTARLNQINTSPLFSESEKEKLANKIKKELTYLGTQVEVNDAEEL